MKNWIKKPSLEFPPGNMAASVWQHSLIPLRVLISIAQTKDGSKWHHLSVSRPDRIRRY